MTPDTLLLSRIRSGDEQAFTELYNRYYKLLYLAAYYRLLKTKVSEEEASNEAADIVQNIFSGVWSGKEIINPDIVKACLYRHVKNACINRIRHMKYVREYYRICERTEPVTTWDTLEAKQLGAMIARAIQTIPEGCRLYFQLQYVEGYSQKEIAAYTGTSIQNIKNQVSKALGLLRGKLRTA